MFSQQTETMTNPVFVENEIKKFNLVLNDLLNTDKNLAISASAFSGLLLVVRYASLSSIALLAGAGYLLTKYMPFLGGVDKYFVGPKEYEERSLRGQEFTKQLNGLIVLYRQSCTKGPKISYDPLFLNLVRTIAPYVINGEDLNPWGKNNPSDLSEQFHQILSEPPHYIKPPVSNKSNSSLIQNVFGLFYKKNEIKPAETKNSEESLLQPERAVSFIRQKLYAVKMG